MIEKYTRARALNLLVAFIILLTIICLIRARVVWDWVGLLLLIGVGAIVFTTLLVREKKQARLLEFFLKSLVISYIVTSIIWFIWPGITLFGVFILSLLPVSISVIIYGIFRIKLKAWEIFLSSWYVSIFAVFTIGAPPPASQYSSIAMGIGGFVGQVFLSLFVAGILTGFYVILKEKRLNNKK